MWTNWFWSSHHESIRRFMTHFSSEVRTGLVGSAGPSNVHFVFESDRNCWKAAGPENVRWATVCYGSEVKPQSPQMVKRLKPFKIHKLYHPYQFSSIHVMNINDIWRFPKSWGYPPFSPLFAIAFSRWVANSLASDMSAGHWSEQCDWVIYIYIYTYNCLKKWG